MEKDKDTTTVSTPTFKSIRERLLLLATGSNNRSTGWKRREPDVPNDKRTREKQNSQTCWTEREKTQERKTRWESS